MSERTADALFSQLIRLRDGACVICGSVRDLECAHLIRRGYHAVRYEPRNAVALCSRCHGHMTRHPLEWNVWRTERLGGAVFAVLWKRAMDGARPDLPSVMADLRAQIKAVAA